MGLVPQSSPEMIEPFCIHPTVEMDTLESRQLRIIRVKVLLVFLACSLIFLNVFGPFRRCYRNCVFKLVGFVVYTISIPAVAYTLGLMQESTFCNQMFPFGAAFLVVVLGSADSYIAHSLENNEQWKSFSIDSLIKCTIAGSLIGSYVPTSKLMSVAVGFMFFVFLKVDERARALMSASKCSMQKTFNSVADYMNTEHLYGNSSPDGSFMDGYRYLVREAGETKLRQKRFEKEEAPEYRVSLAITDEDISIDKVWKCEGRLLREGDPDNRLKDLCLSFSLFKLICLRFASHSLPPEAHAKLRSLIQNIHEKDGYERLFRIMETELAFLFDQLYTNFSVTLSLSRIVLKVLQLFTVLAFFVATLSSYEKSQNGTMWYNADTLVTLLMMTAILTIEIVQFNISIFSEWAKISYICMYVRKKWCQDSRCATKLIEMMCRVKLRKPWEGQLRQYSLLEKCDYRPSKLIDNSLISTYFYKTRDGQEEIDPTKLSREVMKAIAQSLIDNGSRDLKNGIASLVRNNVFGQLSWACTLESTTHVILVWHIATCLCEHKQPRQDSQGQRENFNVATTLSKYLAYLVVFAPELLPDHPCRSECIVDHAVREARDIFERKSTLIERIMMLTCIINKKQYDETALIERIRMLTGIINKKQYDKTIVGRGARLGGHFLEETPNRVWMILADFWVEMMLYVAPSEDTEAHAKYLATGGEFVTHVWVLLSHAGIRRSLHGSEQHDPEGR